MNRWRRIRNEEGAAAVEAAVSAFVGMALLLGSCQLFLALYSYHFVSYAARDATRWAIVRGSDCSTDSGTMPNCNAAQSDIQTHVQSLSFPGINTSNLTATATWYSSNNSIPVAWSSCTTGTCNAPGNLVKVTVTYAYPLILPQLTGHSFAWAHSTANITSTSQMVISQ